MKKYQIDEIHYGHNRIYVRGWAVPNNFGTASVRLIDEIGQEQKAFFFPEEREDVNQLIPSEYAKGAYGFIGFARVDTNKNYYLELKDSQGKTFEKISLKHVFQTRFSKNQERITPNYHDYSLKKRGVYGRVSMQDELYAEWLEKRTANENSLATQQKAVFAKDYTFSILFHVQSDDVTLVEEELTNLLKQSYQNIHIYVLLGTMSLEVQQAIKKIVADNEKISYTTKETAFSDLQGDYAMILDTAGILSKQACYEYACQLQENPSANLIYCDSDELLDDVNFHFNPMMKPDYSYAFLHAYNYIGKGYLFRTELLKEAGLLGMNYAEVSDFDLLLRLTDAAKNKQVLHLARVLYSIFVFPVQFGEKKEDLQELGKQDIAAISASFSRNGLQADIRQIPNKRAYFMTPVLKEKPLVSILIPNKDHKEDLERCLNSLQKSTYENYEVIIIENNSTSKEIFDYYETLKQNARIQVVSYEGGFNYSAINNIGAAHAKGAFLLLLNNDTEVISPDFLESMVFYASCPNTGIVGAKLLYPDRTIQHAGVIVGVDGKEINHIFAFTEESFDGYLNRLMVPSNYTAVTGACLLVKRAVFDKIGGLNEDLPIAYNDIDFCLKAQEAGFEVIYDAFAKLYHFESKSRGYEVSEENKIRREKEKEKLMRAFPSYMRFDRYYSENLSIEQGTYMLPLPKEEGVEKDRDRLFYFIDSQVKSDETLTVLGWAISTQHDVSIRLTTLTGKEIPFTIQPIHRIDVGFAIMHDYSKPNCGFKITFNHAKNPFGFLVISDGVFTKRRLITDEGVYMTSYQPVQTAKDYLRHFSQMKRDIKEEGIVRFTKQFFGDMRYSNYRYEKWFKDHTPSYKELVQQHSTSFPYAPKISLIVPAFRTPEKFLKEMIHSVQAQTYENWELCIADGSFPDDSVDRVLREMEEKDARIRHIVLAENYGISGNTNKALEMATGDWVALMDHDDILVPNTLYEMVKTMNEDSDVEVIYTDEDKINADLTFVFEPAFKPDYDEALFTSGNYICHFFAAKREVISRVGEFDPLCDGAQDFDFILRVIHEGKKVSHINRILYHWRSHPNSTAGDSTSKMYCYEAGARAVNKHYERKQIPATAFISPYYGHYHTFYTNDLTKEPLISVLIYGNQEADIERTKQAVLSASNYQNYEFIQTEDWDDAVKKAKGMYLFFIQAGSVFMPFHLETPWGANISENKVNRFAFPYNYLGELTYEGASIVGGRVADNQKTICFGGSSLHEKHGVDILFLGESHESFGYMFKLMDRSHTNYLSFQNVMMKKETYEKLGMSKEYHTTFKEVDFCFRARENQMTLIFDPLIMVQTNVHQNELPLYVLYEEEARRVAKEHQALLQKQNPYETAHMMTHMNRYVLKEK